MRLDEADWGRDGDSSMYEVPIEGIAVWYAREAEPEESVFTATRGAWCDFSSGSFCAACRPYF